MVHDGLTLPPHSPVFAHSGDFTLYPILFTIISLPNSLLKIN